MLQTNVVIFTRIISGLPAATLGRPLHHSLRDRLLPFSDPRKLKGTVLASLAWHVPAKLREVGALVPK